MSNEYNRRDFLKMGAIVGAGVGYASADVAKKKD